jgi:hypothetical protein
MSIRKSRVTIYMEFFEPQNTEWLENRIRELAREKKLPPFNELSVMIDHKNLKRVSDKPLVILREDLT